MGDGDGMRLSAFGLMSVSLIPSTGTPGEGRGGFIAHAKTPSPTLPRRTGGGSKAMQKLHMR